MRPAGENSRCSPKRSTKVGRKSAGGSGRIASAGGSLTALLTATAAPIAARTGLEIELYDASDLAAFADTLRATEGVHLVVGHSNTTPPLVQALGGDPGSDIDEASEYDRLYVVTIQSDTVSSRIDRYGIRYEREESGATNQ